MLELSPDCILIAPEETKVVGAYAFGAVPLADSCEGSTITCVYDEVPEETQPVPRWFEQELEGTVFSFTNLPYDPQSFVEGAESSKLIGVTLMSALPGGSLPTEIVIEVLYNQEDSNLKRIVECNMYYTQVKQLSPGEWSGDIPVEYQLKFLYRALNHKELLIRFEFDIGFYMSLNLIIGTVSVLWCAVFLLYHRVFTQEKRPQPFRFWSFIRMMIPEAAKGLVYACLPIITVL